MSALAAAAVLCALCAAGLAAALAVALRLRARLAASEESVAAQAAARIAAESRAALATQAREAEAAQAAGLREALGAARSENAGLRDALASAQAARAAAAATAEARSQQLQASEERSAGLARQLAEEAGRTRAEQRVRGDAEAALGRLEAQLSAERAGAAEKQALLQQAEQRLTDTFHRISGAALEQGAGQLLKLAEARFAQLHESAQGDLAARQQAIDQLVAPVREQLERVGGKLHELETLRLRDHATLSETLRGVAGAQEALKGETQRLVAALRAPQTRGRWAELHLRRVVELAGLQEHCDFVEQATVTSEEGTLRPDLVVRLPGGSQVVIDAKAPLLAWLEANEAGGPLVLDEQQRRALYQSHARQVRNHVGSLSDKAYWSQFDRAPDFVVLFLPTEAALGAALEADPELQELAITRHVLLATPMTLIALLRTVAYGWRQDAMAQNARQISEAARTLYERLARLAEHFGAVGKHLGRSVEAYNAALGSLESRVLPAARVFREAGAVPGNVELPLLPPVEASPRAVQAGELAAPVPEDAN